MFMIWDCFGDGDLMKLTNSPWRHFATVLCVKAHVKTHFFPTSVSSVYYKPCTPYTLLTHSAHTLRSHTPLTPLTLHSHTPLTHSTHTLHSHTPLTHSTHTLHSHTPLTPLTHSTHTPLAHSTHTPLTHPTHTLHSHTPLTHCTHNLWLIIHNISLIHSDNHHSHSTRLLLTHHTCTPLTCPPPHFTHTHHTHVT